MSHPSWMTHAERTMADRFPKDTAGHRMTVLHDDGLYRHLRFNAPGTSFYWFDLVTWPGTLVVNGDCGSFTFSRVEDMFTFFRSNGNSAGINPGYWSEKLPTNGRDAARQYSEKVLRARLDEELREYAEVYPGLFERYEADLAVYETTPEKERYPWALKGPREPHKPMPSAEAIELLADYDADGWLSHREGAMELLSELETGGVVSDIFEWKLDDYAWEFLWACHAIVWGIAQYDAAREVAA